MEPVALAGQAHQAVWEFPAAHIDAVVVAPVEAFYCFQVSIT